MDVRLEHPHDTRSLLFVEPHHIAASLEFRPAPALIAHRSSLVPHRCSCIAHRCALATPAPVENCWSPVRPFASPGLQSPTIAVTHHRNRPVSQSPSIALAHRPNRLRHRFPLVRRCLLIGLSFLAYWPRVSHLPLAARCSFVPSSASSCLKDGRPWYQLNGAMSHMWHALQAKGAEQTHGVV